jgi:hypothetical protein
MKTQNTPYGFVIEQTFKYKVQNKEFYATEPHWSHKNYKTFDIAQDAINQMNKTPYYKDFTFKIIPLYKHLDNLLSIDDVLDLYNNSGEECPALDPDRTTLEYGAYTIEEFVWWLKKYNYKFIKEETL